MHPIASSTEQPPPPEERRVPGNRVLQNVTESVRHGMGKAMVVMMTFLPPGASIAEAKDAPSKREVAESVDVIEINHFYDDQGQLVLRQFIFYAWDPTAARYQIVAWRRVTDERQLPLKDWSTGQYVLRWHDARDHVPRIVRATSVNETWTDYDPELAEEAFLPRERRRDLRRPSCDPEQALEALRKDGEDDHPRWFRPQ